MMQLEFAKATTLKRILNLLRTEVPDTVTWHMSTDEGLWMRESQGPLLCELTIRRITGGGGGGGGERRHAKMRLSTAAMAKILFAVEKDDALTLTALSGRPQNPALTFSFVNRTTGTTNGVQLRILDDPVKPPVEVALTKEVEDYPLTIAMSSRRFAKMCSAFPHAKDSKAYIEFAFNKTDNRLVLKGAEGAETQSIAQGETNRDKGVDGKLKNISTSIVIPAVLGPFVFSQKYDAYYVNRIAAGAVLADVIRIWLHDTEPARFSFSFDEGDTIDYFLKPFETGVFSEPSELSSEDVALFGIDDD